MAKCWLTFIHGSESKTENLIHSAMLKKSKMKEKRGRFRMQASKGMGGDDFG